MISRELLAQVRRIEIRTRRIVDDITGGAYHSVFKGRGIEFDEVREYTHEDDVRDIDWNVTARMGAPYIKKYVEERELTVMLMVDASASERYGSGARIKHIHTVETAALLAFSAIRNHDRVGLSVFTDRTELFVPPRSGKTHGLRLIRELMAISPKGRGTRIGDALENIMRVLHKKAVIFLISDLLDETGFERTLRIANRRHDVIAVRVLDPLELAIPRTGTLVVEDFENGRGGFFRGGNSGAVRKYAEAAGEIHAGNRSLCRRAKVDLIDIRCGDDFVKPFVDFFRSRSVRKPVS
jgi:uncharacterized protein (DUF58 family)